MFNRFRLEKGIVPYHSNSGRLPRLLMEGMRQIVHHAVVKAQREYIDQEVERFRTHLTAKMKETIELEMVNLADEYFDNVAKPAIRVDVKLREVSNA